jgi:hypothetical protein
MAIEVELELELALAQVHELKHVFLFEMVLELARLRQ